MLADAGEAVHADIVAALATPFAREVEVSNGAVNDRGGAGAEIHVSILFGVDEHAGKCGEVCEDVEVAVEFELAAQLVNDFEAGGIAPDICPLEESRDQEGEFMVAAFFQDGFAAICEHVDGGKAHHCGVGVRVAVGDGVLCARGDEVPDGEFAGKAFVGAGVGIVNFGGTSGAPALNELCGGVLKLTAEFVYATFQVLTNAEGSDRDGSKADGVGGIFFREGGSCAEEGIFEEVLMDDGVEVGAGEGLQRDLGGILEPELVFFCFAGTGAVFHPRLAGGGDMREERTDEDVEGIAGGRGVVRFGVFVAEFGEDVALAGEDGASEEIPEGFHFVAGGEERLSNAGVVVHWLKAVRA